MKDYMKKYYQKHPWAEQYNKLYRMFILFGVGVLLLIGLILYLSK